MTNSLRFFSTTSSDLILWKSLMPVKVKYGANGSSGVPAFCIWDLCCQVVNVVKQTPGKEKLIM